MAVRLYLDGRSKKLFLDTDDVVIAGVASGLAVYFGIETVLMRIILAVLGLTNGFGVLLYFVFWIAMPEAKTASDKLQMKGRPVILESLDKFVKETASNIKEKAPDRSASRRVASRFASAIKFIFQRLLPIMGKIIGVVIFAAATGAVVALAFTLALLFVNMGSPYVDFSFYAVVGNPLFTLLVISGFLVALVPLLFIQRLGLLLVRGRDRKRGHVALALLGLWFITIIVLGVLLSRAIPQYQDFMDRDPSYKNTVQAYDMPNFDSLDISNGIEVGTSVGQSVSVQAEG